MARIHAILRRGVTCANRFHPARTPSSLMRHGVLEAGRNRHPLRRRGQGQPSRIPLTKGTARTPVDAALYAALLVMLVVALSSDGTGPIPALGTTVGVLPLWQIWTILGLLAVLSLRDKVIFLAARGEVYAS